MKYLLIMMAVSLCLTGMLFSGCNKAIDVSAPENQLVSAEVFADSVSATAAMVNVYALFDKTLDPNCNKWMGLYSDELSFTAAGASQLEVYHSTLSVNNVYVKTFWANAYFIIYSCNDLIAHLPGQKNISPSFIARTIGEAKFLRAYAYFYLVNVFGKIPLILTTDVNVTMHATQSDSLSVYLQITKDLKDAENVLPDNYGTSRLRATKWAAMALLSRVFLYQHDWTEAETFSGAIINSPQFTPLPALNGVFKTGSRETILEFGTQYGYIADASSLIPPAGSMPTFAISSSLLNAFEIADQRKAAWLGNVIVNGSIFYYPFKYQNSSSSTSGTENLVALRAGEQYLIRAEARAELNDLSGALDDLNIIRQRAGLQALNYGLDQQGCIKAVMQERRIEFLAEWGQRFFDLKRTGQVNEVMDADKPTWKPNAALWPLPVTEIEYDPNLQQNPGY